jgi:hypothetical protein
MEVTTSVPSEQSAANMAGIAVGENRRKPSHPIAHKPAKSNPKPHQYRNRKISKYQK